MKQSSEHSSSEKSDKIRLTPRAKHIIGGLAAGATFAIGGVEVGNQIMDSYRASAEELQLDTVSYSVYENGYLSSIAAGLNVEDTTYAAGILAELNPEWSGKVVPEGTVIKVPREYLGDNTSTHISVDLDNNTATIRQ